MQNKVIFLSIAALLFLSACPDSPTNPKDDNPYKQESIDWPSLADSPWPMYRHDPQNTGRSPYPGALSGTIVSRYPSNESQSGVVVGIDSTLFFYNVISGVSYLQATDLGGNIKWSKEVHREPSATPVVLYDGSIVTIGLEDGEFIRLTSTGDTLWQCFVDVDYPLWAQNVGITVGLDTTVYYFTVFPERLIAIGKNGVVKWSLSDDRFYPGPTNFPVFSPDGKTLYLNGDNGVALVAVNIEDQSISWTYGSETLECAPMVDNEGNIFIYNAGGYSSSDDGDFAFVCLNPDGSLRWKFPMKKKYTYELNPAIDREGNVYFGTDTLFSFTNDGKFRWQLPKKGIECALTIDSNNNIYGFRKDEYLVGYCVNISGDPVWDMNNTSEFTRLGGSPIIVNNSILVPGWRSEWIYVIH